MLKCSSLYHVWTHDTQHVVWSDSILPVSALWPDLVATTDGEAHSLMSEIMMSAKVLRLAGSSTQLVIDCDDLWGCALRNVQFLPLDANLCQNLHHREALPGHFARGYFPHHHTETPHA